MMMCRLRGVEKFKFRVFWLEPENGGWEFNANDKEDKESEEGLYIVRYGTAASLHSARRVCVPFFL